MTYLLSIDPGMSTGIVLGKFTGDTAYERILRWQVEEGLYGFFDWHESIPGDWLHAGVVVVEKFVPLPMARTFKTEELEPIRIEGAIEALGISPVWQRAASMVLAGGDTPAQRKRRSDDRLRALGLWSTPTNMGKDYTLKDCNDINSAQKHAISYLRSISHKPTLDFLEGFEDDIN